MVVAPLCCLKANRLVTTQAVRSSGTTQPTALIKKYKHSTTVYNGFRNVKMFFFWKAEKWAR